MFNVSTLLLDDAPLKCVVTEVVLFSIVAFKLTFHKVAYSDTLEVWWDLSNSIITNVLLILGVKKCENRSIFDVVNAYNTKCASFFGPPCMFSAKGWGLLHNLVLESFQNTTVFWRFREQSKNGRHQVHVKVKDINAPDVMISIIFKQLL